MSDLCVRWEWRSWAAHYGEVMATLGGHVRRVLVALAAAVVVVLGAGPAAAHDEIVGTAPANGATVDVAPDRVVLTFAEPAIALGTQVVVTGPDGAVASQGDVMLEGTTVAQPLVASRPAGTYHVDWRVTSADGHPVTGTFMFTATNSTPVAATQPATTEPATTSPASTAPSPSPSATVPAGSPVGADPTAASGTNTRVGIAILVLVVLALVAVRLGRARSLRRMTAKDGVDHSGTAGGA